MSFYGWRQQTRQQKNSVELEASLAPAEAEVGAVAKADQYPYNIIILSQPNHNLNLI